MFVVAFHDDRGLGVLIEERMLGDRSHDVVTPPVQITSVRMLTSSPDVESARFSVGWENAEGCLHAITASVPSVFLQDGEDRISFPEFTLDTHRGFPRIVPVDRPSSSAQVGRVRRQEA
ncbi:hypothetical protein GCM10009808_20120 [Microbacterium sediminicola]|uniref:Uncharacterized protein n=1 Tax=Microbacterium sediminicola TaxID=415210 RepID=A0ABP4UBZ1_9MICO